MRTPIRKRTSEIIARTGTSISSLEIEGSRPVKPNVATELMTEQKASMENLAERFEAFPEAWIQNELLEQTRDYLIPTAPNIDSLRDSQIRESLTRCWLLKEEQHRWVQRLRSDGLILRHRLSGGLRAGRRMGQ